MLDPIAAKKLSIEEIRRRNQVLLDKEQRGEALTSDEQQEKTVLANAMQFKLDEQEAQSREEAERTRREHERHGYHSGQETGKEPFWFRKAF